MAPSRCNNALHWISSHTHAGISNSGQYSVARLLALSQYCERTPSWRVAGMCVLTVVPPLSAIILLDVLPLQDPADGWSRNVTVWVRSFAGSVMLSFGVTLLFQALVPRAEMTIIKATCVSLAAATGYLAALIAIAKYWVFPIPFTILVGVPPWTLCFYAGLLLAIGPRKIRDDNELQAQIRRFANLMGFQSTFLVIYPVYDALFHSLSGWNQFAFVFVLPMIKFVLKKLLARIMDGVDDLVPLVVVSVDLFNALYQSKCMRGSGSLATTLGIIGIDFVQNLASLHHLFHDITEIEALAGVSIRSEGFVRYTTSLVERLSKGEQTRALESLQLESYIGLKLSGKKHTLLDAMAQHRLNDQQQRRRATQARRNSVVPSRWLRVVRDAFSGSARNVVIPWVVVVTPTAPSGSVTPMPPKRSIRPRAPEDADTVALKRILHLLWRCELVFLVEYIESAIPILYALSLSILYALPNAAYYPDVSTMTPPQLHAALTSIGIYAALELASLALIHSVLQRKLQFSALHQLAFVFESEWRVLQGTFMAWAIVVLQFTLVHFGIDFTFQFKWIAGK